MKRRGLSLLFTLIGFAASIGFPVWAVSTQITVLLKNCGESALDRLGVTLSGFVVIACIVGLVLWKYLSAVFREKLKSQRTALGFFCIGYAMVFIINYLSSALELIFLFGAIGAAIAAICFRISDHFKGGK
jgi:DMSO/TMAO reductase YedYZ heme-binding membrane subunit